MNTKTKQEDIFVTSPLLPDLDDFMGELKAIWNKKWLTNNGTFHRALEEALAEYLQVPYLSLFTNGTLPLIAGLQEEGISGEVITTPFSFVATTHALWWNGIKPVFADIDPVTCNLNPECIEAAVTSRTTAIMPVHVYGTPCDTVAIQRIADKYGLKVIYDAAHAFGVRVKGESLLKEGDMSALSFHATKVYNTIEGGALIMKDENMKHRIDCIRNFGFANETTIVAPGINAKMDELRAMYGLLNLKKVDAAIDRRCELAHCYREALRHVEGISCLQVPLGVRSNAAYFPIFVNEERYGLSRDALYAKMDEMGVHGRRYFYPLISSFSTYAGLPSADPTNLPVATRMANEVICLPMYAELTDEDVNRVLDLIVK